MIFSFVVILSSTNSELPTPRKIGQQKRAFGLVDYTDEAELACSMCQW